jgi:hypothetical protein
LKVIGTATLTLPVAGTDRTPVGGPPAFPAGDTTAQFCADAPPPRLSATEVAYDISALRASDGAVNGTALGNS